MENVDVSDQSGRPAPSPPASHLAIQARRLEARAHICAKEGKIADSLNIANEAVAAWRAAVAQEANLSPELARCLGQLSMRYWALEQFGDALGLAVESVNLWRKLANQDFESHAYNLFQALMRLAPQAAKRHYKDFFALKEEGAELLLRLLPADEGRYLLPTAQACQWIADKGGSFGYPRHSRSYAEKSVALWRRLADQDLLTYGPPLIRALRQLSVEQLDPRVGWGKAPLRDARRVRLAYVKLRVLTTLGLRRSKPENSARTAKEAKGLIIAAPSDRSTV